MKSQTTTPPTEGWLQWLVRLWKAVTHSHTWQRINDASIMDVNDTYPPTHIDYISPKRWCPECGRMEWYVGPEVCGGDRARWVPFSPWIDDDEPNTNYPERLSGDHPQNQKP